MRLTSLLATLPLLIVFLFTIAPAFAQRASQAPGPSMPALVAQTADSEATAAAGWHAIAMQLNTQVQQQAQEIAALRAQVAKLTPKPVAASAPNSTAPRPAAPPSAGAPLPLHPPH